MKRLLIPPQIKMIVTNAATKNAAANTPKLDVDVAGRTQSANW
jgi:hypothetical protein